MSSPRWGTKTRTEASRSLRRRRTKLWHRPRRSRTRQAVSWLIPLRLLVLESNQPWISWNWKTIQQCHPPTRSCFHQWATIPQYQVLCKSKRISPKQKNNSQKQALRTCRESLDQQQTWAGTQLKSNRKNKRWRKQGWREKVLRT